MAQETALVATFALNYDVRIIKIGDEFWFVAVDVAKVLGIEKIRNTLAHFPEDESRAHTMGVRSKNGVFQNRKLLCVNEAGLYRLIFISRKPEAENFKRWVFHDVLPQIRKTGSYNANTTKLQENLLDEFQPDGTFNDVAVILRTLEEKGIEYDFEFIGVTPKYNENAKKVMPTYNFKLKIKD